MIEFDAITLERFVGLAYVESKSYDTISKELNIPKKEVGKMYSKYRDLRKPISAARTLFYQKSFKQISFPMFYDIYSKMEFKCYYGDLTQADVDRLFELQKVYTKRQNTRGKKLELERVLPNESYANLKNLRLCCYWCNNAKSDEFSEEEFRPIASEIHRVLKKRLA